MRNTVTTNINAEGRDFGKVFLLTEMPASQGEWWAIRALMALMRSGMELPEDWNEQPWAVLAGLGFKALSRIPAPELKPMLDEMFQCVQVVPNPKEPRVWRALNDDDIEEIITRLTLRKDIFALHTGFFSRADPSTSESAAVKTKAAS